MLAEIKEELTGICTDAVMVVAVVVVVSHLAQPLSSEKCRAWFVRGDAAVVETSTAIPACRRLSPQLEK